LFELYDTLVDGEAFGEPLARDFVRRFPQRGLWRGQM
jgi:hypothetical protein